MGAQPSAATHAAAAEPEPGSGTPIPVAASGRFGMPDALVITVCIVTAATLAELGMAVRDVLMLIAGAASIGAVVVALLMTGGRQGDWIGRFVRAYFSADN
ncbi:hypothetical protein ACFY3M_55495 [Streptomyces mirabilis]|uniref:hypothetical protein n=1 Tax=Streptomyces mirabilis TaxID=68239 RepID=UPI0036B779B7